MKNIYAIIAVFVAGSVMAQNYNYDATNKALEISGDGSASSKALTTPITPGSAIPGSSSTFGETTSVTLKDITATVGAGKTNAIAPVSSSGSVKLKLENATLTTTTAIDGSGHPQTIEIDSESTLKFMGRNSLLRNTDRIQNSGNLQYTVVANPTGNTYLWESNGAGSVGCSGILGGTGLISMANPNASYSSSSSMGLIKYDKSLSDLHITGNYTVDLDNVSTIGNAYIAGIDNIGTNNILTAEITGTLTVKAAKSTAYGVIANTIGSYLTGENNYSGEINVSAKKVYGIMATQGSTTPSETTLGKIYKLNVGKLTVTGDGDYGTGIMANEVTKSLNVNEMEVTGTKLARGLVLSRGNIATNETEGITIGKLTVKTNDNVLSSQTAAGLVAGGLNSEGSTPYIGGTFERLQLGTLEVSANNKAYGIIGGVNNITLGDTLEIGSITVTATNGEATGIWAVDRFVGFKLTDKIEAQGSTWASGIYNPNGNVQLELADGATITAQTSDANATECSAIHADNIQIDYAPNATFTGDVIANNMTLASGINLTINGNVYSNVSGEGANSFAKSFYKIDALDVGGLVGTHNPSASEKQIQGTLSDTAISGGSLTGSFTNGDTASGTALSWEITENTYFQDQSTTAKEKQIAKIVDSVAYTGDSATDTANVAKKQNLAAAMAAGLGMSALDMSTVAKTAYENAALAEDIYWDTFFRAGRLMDTWQGEGDELNAKLPKRFRNARMQSWEVSVRTINRFGTAGGESDGDEYDYNTYGGMAQVDKQLGDILVGGGVGGWFSKTKDGAAGKADSDIIAVTLYADWNIGYNLDWFGEVYYGRAMNTLKKQGVGGDINADWDANLIGGFTAIRYNWQVMDSVSIKPFAGVMLAYNMQDSLNTDAAKVEAKDYTNCKGVVGVEAAWQPVKNLYLSGRVMYGYEFADCKYDVSTEVLGWGRASYTGYETSRSSVIAGIGVNYQFLTNWNVGVSYNAEFRSSKLNNNINASVGYKF